MLVALFAPVVAPFNPNEQDLVRRLQPPGSSGVSKINLLGTDQLGRDIFSRLVFGARLSIFVAVVSVSLSLGLGLVLGLQSGYFGGWIDAVVMRLVELQMSFPFILLALAVLAVIGPSITNIILLFVITSWPIYARTIRGSVLAFKQTSIIESARAIGRGDQGILWTYVFPNCVSSLAVIASFEAARIILMESALGFLGLGVQPPTATWGNMIGDGREYIWSEWWLGTFPGLAIMITVLAMNFLGDAARDYMDPTLKDGSNP